AGPGAGLGQGGGSDRLAGAEPALTPRAYAWLPLATDFEARRRAEALGQDADTISYRLLKGFLAPNLGTPFAVPVVDGYENLMTREQALLVAALGSERAGTAGDSSPTGLTRLPPNERRRRLGERWGLLAAAGAGTVFSGDRLRPEAWPPTVRYERAAVPGEGGTPDLNVYRFTRPLPRAFVADSWAVATGPQEALGRLLGAPPGPDGAPPVVVVAPQGSAAPPLAPLLPRPPGTDSDAIGPREARIVRYEPHTVEVETESDREGLLVLLDANAPGWTATVTGAPATILTANVAFRAVAIPAGRHLVTFSYAPPAWGAALGLTLVAALALALWGAWLLVAARPADR
ncbi:MAG TPA: YfhO family protein, partial [Chloroflexota bacterium]|nr:YfhO family protein [Chloroflexota bacterium]